MLLLLVGWEGDSASILSGPVLAGSLPGGGAGVGIQRCQGEQHLHGDARPDQVSWPPLPLPSSAKSANTASQLSRCIFSTIGHFCHLPLAHFPQALHQPGTSPRNTMFAQTGSRVEMYGRGVPQLFLLLCSQWTWFGSGIHQPPLPAGPL